MKIPHIKNALENISTACEKQLAEIYPAGIPEPIQQRYEQELTCLSASDSIDDFEIFRCLSNEAEKSSSIIDTRGVTSGSFLYFLLGKNSFNPLPVHYYCPKCGYFESVKTHLFGIDLPEKKCPHCEKNIIADGYNLSPESIWSDTAQKTISFDYNINTDFLPFAKRVLSSLYPENCIVPIGIYRLTSSSYTYSPDEQVIGISQFGFGILPVGSDLNDYPDLATFLDNGEPCITGSTMGLKEHLIKPVLMYPSSILDSLIHLQRAMGIYVNELKNNELHNISWRDIYNTTALDNSCKLLFHQLKPKTYKDMIALNASVHNSFSWQKPGDTDINIFSFIKMISSESFKKFPCYTREDFFDYLVENGVDRPRAYKASEFIRKGKASAIHPLTPEQQKQLGIPDAAAEVAKNYSYLFPRAHCIELVLALARLAYYAKSDKRTFNQIFFKKK